MVDGEGYKGSNVPQDEFFSDVETFQSFAGNLRNILDDDTLTNEQKEDAFRKESQKLLELIEKYELDENEHLQEDIENNVGDIGYEIEAIAEDYNTLVKSNLPANPANTDQVENLKVLYEKTLHMDGLSDEEKLEHYEEFLSEYYDYAIQFSEEEDFSTIVDQINTQIGMPEYAFPDKGAELVAIYASKLKELGEKADDYSKNDARAELIKDGLENPTTEQIEYHYLSQKADLYQEAAYYIGDIEDRYYMDEDDIERMETQAGYSKDYLEQRIGEVQYNMPKRPSFAPQTDENNAPDAPERTTVDILSESTQKHIDNAESFTMADARDKLVEQGKNDPSIVEIEREFIKSKMKFYNDALDNFKYYSGDQDMLEKRSEVSVEYIEKQVEILQNQKEQLDFDHPEEGMKQKDTDDLSQIPTDMPQVTQNNSTYSAVKL